MKKILISLAAILIIIPAIAQADRAEILTSLEQEVVRQVDTPTATLKAASRLFSVRDDLTSVLIIIPSGSGVKVIDSDSTYYLVEYNETRGYIFKKQAVIDNNQTKIAASQPENIRSPITEDTGSAPKNRFALLEEKYGADIAKSVYSGKIWKGMTAEMVTDSWGSPRKINRIINGNTLREEWTYKSTTLYFEKNVLSDWGPVKK